MPLSTCRMWDFYPRPPRGGRPSGGGPPRPRLHISIHALREEGDAGRRQHSRLASLFLSTPSARRATPQLGTLCLTMCDFYPRPPRGGRRSCIRTRITRAKFLSTPSARRATYDEESKPYYAGISIHALREEGDAKALNGTPQSINFYPRPPRGGRPGFVDLSGYVEKISIHALREEGDVQSLPPLCRGNISIHALREEGDFNREMQNALSDQFLSTPSARRATQADRQIRPGLLHFYPRPPRGGRRAAVRPCLRMPAYFYPRPPRGGRPAVVLLLM